MEPPKDAYTKTYKVRAAGKNTKTIEVSVPRDMVLRMARRANLSLEEYLKQYRAVAHYDDFDGVFYQFQKVASQ